VPLVLKAAVYQRHQYLQHVVYVNTTGKGYAVLTYVAGGLDYGYPKYRLRFHRFNVSGLKSIELHVGVQTEHGDVATVFYKPAFANGSQVLQGLLAAGRLTSDDLIDLLCCLLGTIWIHLCSMIGESTYSDISVSSVCPFNYCVQQQLQSIQWLSDLQIHQHGFVYCGRAYNNESRRRTWCISNICERLSSSTAEQRDTNDHGHGNVTPFLCHLDS